MAKCVGHTRTILTWEFQFSVRLKGGKKTKLRDLAATAMPETPRMQGLILRLLAEYCTDLILKVKARLREITPEARGS